MLPPPYATALLQVLQAKSTEGHARGGDDPEVLKELRTAPDLTPRATKVMARSLGCAMSTLVVQECHLWLCLVDIGTQTNFGSSRFLYPRLASLATKPATWPSSSKLHRSRLRRYNMSCLGGQLLPPPVRRLQRPACSLPRAAPCVPSRSHTASAAAFKSSAVELGVGRPTQRERKLLREKVSASLPPPSAGWIICCFKNLDRKRLSRSLGPKRTWRAMDGSTSGPHSSSLLPAGSSGRFESIIIGSTHAPSAKLWNQVSMHRTLRPLLSPPQARSLRSTSLPYCGYVGGPAGPACTVSGCRGTAQPSRWLLWTIWLSGQPVSSAHSTTAGPVRAFADSQAKVPKKKENSTSACTTPDGRWTILVMSFILVWALTVLFTWQSMGQSQAS